MGSGFGQGSGVGKGVAQHGHDSSQETPYVEGSVFQALHQYEQGINGKGTGAKGNPQGYIGDHYTRSGDQDVWWNRSEAKGDNLVAPQKGHKGYKRDYVPSHKGHWRNNSPRQGLFLLNTQGGSATVFVPYGADITDYLRRGFLVAGQGDENQDYGRWCESLQRKERPGKGAWQAGLASTGEIGKHGVDAIATANDTSQPKAAPVMLSPNGPAGFPKRPPGMPPMMPRNAAGDPPTAFLGWDDQGQAKYSYPDQSRGMSPPRNTTGPQIVPLPKAPWFPPPPPKAAGVILPPPPPKANPSWQEARDQGLKTLKEEKEAREQTQKPPSRGWKGYYLSLIHI